MRSNLANSSFFQTLNNKYPRFTRLIHLCGDIILINASFTIAYFYKYGQVDLINEPNYGLLLGYFNIIWLTLTYFLGVYNISRVAPYARIVLDLLKLLFLHVSLTTVFIVALKGYYYSREHLILTYLLSASLIISWRLMSISLFRFYRKAGGNYRRVVIVGFSDIARELKRFFNSNPHYGYKFIGFFDDRTAPAGDVKGTVSTLKEYVLAHEVDEIYCTMSDIDSKKVNDLIDFAEEQQVPVKVVPDFREIHYRKINIDFYDDFPVLTFREVPLNDILNRVTKRTFDILFSLLVISFVFPWLFPIIALLIKLDSRGPVFFLQRRSGKNNRNFWCLKFRSMRINNESDYKQATRDDDRITRIGRILRKTNLDEMPQFFNVLLGHMSVVGPRPHPLKLDENYQDVIDRYRDRHLVKPGVTGLAQVKGYRGETAHPQLMKNRVRVDLFYIENWSFVLDLKIIMMTVGSMMKGDRNAF